MSNELIQNCVSSKGNVCLYKSKVSGIDGVLTIYHIQKYFCT